jgi:hypothetical protein
MEDGRGKMGATTPYTLPPTPFQGEGRGERSVAVGLDGRWKREDGSRKE